MKSQVNFVYDVKDDPQDELKHWLFLENVRLQQERQEFQEEKQSFIKEKMEVDRELKMQQLSVEMEQKKLSKQKELFEKQWQIMENELRKIARDKAVIEKERENLRKQQAQASSRTYTYTGGGKFFAGVSSVQGLKKRYRELLKIFHPDNDCGDEATVHAINSEYKNLKRQYGID